MPSWSYLCHWSSTATSQERPTPWIRPGSSTISTSAQLLEVNKLENNHKQISTHTPQTMQRQRVISRPMQIEGLLDNQCCHSVTKSVTLFLTWIQGAIMLKSLKIILPVTKQARLHRFRIF